MSRRSVVPDPAETVAGTDAGVIRPEGVRHCKQHGPIPLARAYAGGSGKFRCPEPGCKRFLSSTPPLANSRNGGTSGGEADAGLAGDPDLLSLKKELEIARLKKSIREVIGPLEVDAALGRLAAVERQLQDHGASLGEIRELLDDTPLVETRNRFKCRDCGSERYLAVRIKCTKCNSETWRGWFPKSS
jgi:hypothetical protein